MYLMLTETQKVYTTRLNLARRLAPNRAAAHIGPPACSRSDSSVPLPCPVLQVLLLVCLRRCPLPPTCLGRVFVSCWGHKPRFPRAGGVGGELGTEHAASGIVILLCRHHKHGGALPAIRGLAAKPLTDGTLWVPSPQ